MKKNNNLIKLHADDLGRSKKINSTIFESIDKGYVDSVSVLVNHKYSSQGINGAKKRGVSIRLHLNLTEGRSLYSHKKESTIVDKKNIFSKSFLLFLFAPLFFNYRKIKFDVKKEIDFQIKRYLKLSKSKNLNLDGHQHIHCIPWISNIILENKKKFNLKEIRVPNENFYLSNFNNIFNFWYYKNIIKFILLKILSFFLKKKLIKNNIKFNKSFIGVIDTGHMTMDSIIKGSKKIFQKYNSPSIEILIHPGRSNLNEKNEWEVKNQHLYYIKKERIKELLLSKSKQLKNFLNYENTISN